MYDRYSDIAQAKDYDGMTQLQVNGLVVQLSSQSKCRVIDLKLLKGLYEVRILDGPYMGRAVFVLIDAVRIGG